MMIDLIPVPSTVAPDAVDRSAADIERALKHGGDFNLDDVRRKVASRDWQLWVPTIDGKAMGVVVTHIEQRPAAKVAEIVLLAGKRAKEWMPEGERIIAEWARALDCVAMESRGREGWARRLKHDGWRQASIVLRKELAA